MNRTHDLPELGVGVVWMTGLAPALMAAAADFDFIEVEPQQHWFRRCSGRFRLDHAAFDAIRALGKPCLLHSVGCPIGGTLSLLPDHADALRASVARLDPAWASEHLSFNEFLCDGVRHHGGFLLPPLALPANVATAARNLRAFADCVARPVAFETGVNYLQPQRGEMPDGAFVAAIAEAADCGILLDLHNVWTNARNGRQPLQEFVDMLPLDRVVEVHLAGGESLDGYWLDAHTGLTPPDLMELAAEIIPRLPNLKAITFEMMDEAIESGRCTPEQLAQHLRELRRLWNLRGTAPAVRRLRVAEPDRSPAYAFRWDAAAWERCVGTLALGLPLDDARADALSVDRGIGVLRTLIEAVRAGTVVDALRLSTRLIALGHGHAGLVQLFDDYWRAHSPLPFATDEALRFVDFVASRRLDIPGLPDMLALEAAACRALADGAVHDVTLHGDPVELIEAIEQHRLPDRATLGPPCRLRIGGEAPPG